MVPIRYDSASLPLARKNELLGYRSPALAEKLLHLHMVRSRQEATSLLREVIKYLVISKLHEAESVPMFSRRLDETWHQFVLFTAEYERFCRRFFGSFLHHEPNEASEVAGPHVEIENEMSFMRFQDLYEGLFGPISGLWFDDRSIAAGSRVLLGQWKRPLSMRMRDGMVEALVLRDPPVVLCRAGGRAEEAMRFVMLGEPFHVRELPGLPHEDKVALCRSLVQVGVLQVMP